MIHQLLLAHSVHAPIVTAHLASVVQSANHASSPPAGSGSGSSGGTGGAPTTIQDVANKIKGAIDQIFQYFLPIGLALCALYYGWGGLHYIAAGGSPVLVQKARSIWWHATVGVVGVILATPVVNMVHTLFT